ncbi:MAG: response regulator [Legionella sp.]|nr:response regulator [Legionella sp.]
MMPLKAEFLKQLVETFKVELDEKCQTITDCLFALEKNNSPSEFTKILEAIFRAAHNIKGSARSIGITHVSEIAHEIESLFSAIESKELQISNDIINLCLFAVDGMRSAMKSFSEQTPLAFDIDELHEHLQHYKPMKSSELPNLVPQVDGKKTVHQDTTEYDSIRVPIKQIDHLSALIEQIQATKIALEAQGTELHKSTSTFKSSNGENVLQPIVHLSKLINKHLLELSTITNSLQEEIRRLRLIPASTLLRQLARTVHDLAHELNKKVELEIRGDQVRMDKVILDGLKDPLIHLLRNAIDHGIESPEIRTNLGKTEHGNIILEVSDEGNQIEMTLSDDGAGLDYKNIAQTALNKKLISQAEFDMIKPEILNEFIFRPEFSTKELITDISGRGIGLAIVKSTVNNIKGQVGITSEMGKGTTFHFQLPLTLSSDRGLIIKSGGQLFVIPTSAVEHVLILNGDDIHEVGTNQVVLFNQKPLPLCDLSELLHLTQKDHPNQDKLPILVLARGQERVALLVEEIIGEREIVTKPLNSPLIHVPCIAGGTLLGSNEVIMVLNAGEVIHSALFLGNTNPLHSNETSSSKVRSPHILLVEDSITTRTLEKNILENNHYKVTIATNGKEAWELLQKHSFSLVITDVEMPKMDGFELTSLIKKNEKLQAIPVIIVTSLSNEEQKKRGIEVGANAYIVKNNFESTELLDIVGQLV